MKPAPFQYVRAESTQHCLELLATHGDDACVLAGGQSLMPSLALRLRAPAVLVDINRIAELAAPPLERPGELRLAALTRHAHLMHAAVAGPLPLLGQAAPWIAHAGIRHRGTLGGSLSLGDPASELPACAVALDASLVLRSKKGGERRVRAAEFYRGAFDNDRAPEELIVACDFPRLPDARTAFREVARRKGDYATAGIAASATRTSGGGLGAVRIAFFGVGDRPMLAPSVALAIEQARDAKEAVAGAVAALARDIEPAGDVWHSPAVKAHICRTILKEIVDDLFA